MLDNALAEVANAIWVASVRGLITVVEAEDSLLDFLALPLNIVASRQLLPDALRLSIRYRLAVYDALFVAATAALNISGVTADVPLVQAVKADYPQMHLLRDWRLIGP